MYRGRSVGVVVPTYNEEGTVGHVVREIPAFVDRIYAVDDGSTDGTVDEIRRAARDAPVGDATGSDADPLEGNSASDNSAGRIVRERIREETLVVRTVLLQHRRNFEGAVP